MITACWGGAVGAGADAAGAGGAGGRGGGGVGGGAAAAAAAAASAGGWEAAGGDAGAAQASTRAAPNASGQIRLRYGCSTAAPTKGEKPARRLDRPRGQLAAHRVPRGVGPL